MDQTILVLLWALDHWEYILVGYLAGLGAQTKVGSWLIKLPTQPVKWVTKKLIGGI